MGYEIEEVEERVILVGVADGVMKETEDYSREMVDKELVRTAGATVCGSLLQKREAVHPGTYIGKGKIQELKFLLFETEATGIVCDDELSPAQMSNLERELDCKVMESDTVNPGYFGTAGDQQRGKDSGRTGAASVSSIQTCGARKFPVQTGRRDRNQRSGRKETGDGQTTDPKPNHTVEKAVGGSPGTPGDHPCETRQIQSENSSTGGVLQCGKKHLFK